ncbi:MAG: sigma-70 family RNA polymerase sigma factor [Woeseiaceae bacterium]
MLKTPEAPTRADFHAAIAARGDRWFAVCLRITRDRDLAEDAVQDALLSAWNKRDQFDRSARLDTWIHRIAVNAALQLLRKKRPASFDPLEEDILDTSDMPESRTAAHELGDRLSAALAELSELERVCFVLKHLEQWRLKEIAEHLGTSDGTVKQAVFRAVRKLRPRMAVLQGEMT